jgi:hypothetical protein
MFEFPLPRAIFVSLRVLLLVVLLSRCPLWNTVMAASSQVRVTQDAGGTFGLSVNGESFVIRGAGGTSHLDLLRSLGGNSIRTWGIESLDQLVDGKPLLDRAHDLGIKVAVGIWVQHARHGFDYSDAASLQRQRDAVRGAVRKYRDHPAVLLWGLGNEMEGPTSKGDDERVWKEVNVLAELVKREDPTHPIMTTIAGASPVKVKGMLAHCPLVDILGVNAYAGASGVGRAVKDAGWDRPFILTEFGPPGPWEVPKTAWGAPVEPTSWEKASGYYATSELLQTGSSGLCLGSYAFVWGHKQETTSTWYGMFLRSGEKLPSVDAMARVWTGKWPPNRSPKITVLRVTPESRRISRGGTFGADVVAVDFEGDPLQIEWEFVAENKTTGIGGDAEEAPPSFPEAVLDGKGTKALLRAPTVPGAYRVFVTVRDGKGGASKDNVPVLVE